MTDLPADSRQITLRSGVALGHVRKTPLVLRNLFIELARQAYHPENPRMSSLVQYVWKPEPKKDSNELWINGSHVWQDQSVDFRPAIYVGIAPIVLSAPNVRFSYGVLRALVRANW
jgi:hypothetical protein